MSILVTMGSTWRVLLVAHLHIADTNSIFNALSLKVFGDIMKIFHLASQSSSKLPALKSLVITDILADSCNCRNVAILLATSRSSRSSLKHDTDAVYFGWNVSKNLRLDKLVIIP